MATEIYLGEPPQHVIDWIKAHSKPVGNPKTKITFADGSFKEYDWSGEINQQTMIADGLYNDEEFNWPNNPQTVEIGINVTSIGNYVFNHCIGLTSVTIPSSVTSIGDYVFYFCRGLTSVTIPNSVTSIGYQAFYGCSGLTSVTIPDSVTSIGPSAFENCISLTSVTIPSSVTSIGTVAFYGCSGLTSVTFSGKDKATVKGMTNYSWELKSGCVIHCTDGDIAI